MVVNCNVADETPWFSQLSGFELFGDESPVQKTKSMLIADICSAVTSLADSDDDLSEVVAVLLENKKLYSKIIEHLGVETKKSMKKELKHSKLIDKEKDRKYLLGISPLDLCVEFQENQNDTFDIVCKVLLGVRNPETIFENQFLRNKVCLM